MHSQLSVLLIAVLISASPAAARSDSVVSHFTIQVASFPDKAQAERFAVGLAGVGEDPAFDTVSIEGRGFWTRVFIGLFNSADDARSHAISLVTRGIIEEFLVRKADSILALTRPRRVKDSEGDGSSAFSTAKHIEYNLARKFRDAASTSLPVVEVAIAGLVPRIDTHLIPRPDPASLAFKLVTGEQRQTSGSTKPRGGLWISGDADEALVRLRWIAGEGNAELINLDPDGRVRFDKKLLAKAAGLGESSVHDPLKAVEYISSNEGLLLLVQVALGRHRYLLHLGRQAPTYGKSVDIAGSINLDNNIDSRINPYRKDGKKLDSELPPAGFDSLIALNPVARWFNLNTNSWVQDGEIVFHELAEAYAKLEFSLDYLDQGTRPGAHAVALAREQRLKSQRPDADIVVTTGSNRLLRTEQEIRLFTAEASAAVNQR